MLLWILGTAFALLLAIYPDTCVGARRETSLPGPRPYPLVGNTFGLFWRRKSVTKHFSKLRRRYGEVFTFSVPSWGRIIVVNMPQWIEAIKSGDGSRYGKGPQALTIFNEFPGVSPFSSDLGNLWRLTRKIQAPLYSMQTYNDRVVASASKLLPMARRLLRAISEKEIVIDWNDFCARLTMMYFCETALSMSTDILTEDPTCLSRRASMVDNVTAMNYISAARFFNPFWRLTEKLDGTGSTFLAARDAMHSIIDEIMHERVSRGSNDALGDDFLGGLLRSPHVGDVDLIRGTMLTLLAAGRDNIQNVLAWSMWEISRAPQWFEAMRKEALAMGQPDIVPSYSALADYPVHLAVFYETLRLWPGVPKNGRLALHDDTLPAIPEHDLPAISIRKGDTVFWADLEMMRSDKVWGRDASEFNPGRHLDRDGAFVKPKSPNYHAFGNGPRLCPGQQLSAYEFVAIWTGILPCFSFTVLNDQTPEFAEAYTMSMSDPLRVAVRSLKQ